MEWRPMLFLMLGLVPAILTGQQQGPFELGADHDEISRRFGAATLFYAPEVDRHFVGDIEYSAAADIWTLLDVYPRKTATNEYEFQLKFGFDSRESKLHAVKRLRSIDILIDKPAGYDSILDDLSEAHSLCTDGCKVYGAPLGGEILVMAEHPTSGDVSLATLVYNDFIDQVGGAVPLQVGIRLILRPPVDPNPRARKLQSDWSVPVMRVAIEAMPGDAVLRLPRTKPLLPVLLGTWPR